MNFNTSGAQRIFVEVYYLFLRWDNIIWLRLNENGEDIFSKYGNVDTGCVCVSVC